MNPANLTNLQNKSLFITGGTGFFGIWLLHLLQALNDNEYNITVTILSRNPEKFLNQHPNYKAVKWLHWIKDDVTNYTIPPQPFDFIIHGAADTKPEAMAKPSSVFENIMLGTRQVLEHAVACNAQRVMIISSGAVYGEISFDENIKEDVNTAPLTNKTANAYGEAKRAAEMLAACYAEETSLHVIIARCFAFAGSGIGQHLVLDQLIRQALNNDEIIIKGSGGARRSYLHGQDLAIWLLTLLTDGVSGEIYNVGSDIPYTILELATLIRNIIDPQKQIVVSGGQDQRMNYIPSIEKAKLLGLDVWTSLEDSIKEMIVRF